MFAHVPAANANIQFKKQAFTGKVKAFCCFNHKQRQVSVEGKPLSINPVHPPINTFCSLDTESLRMKELL